MSTRAVAAGALLAGLAVPSACTAGQGPEGSALCDALAVPVPGIEEVVAANGFTCAEANWATMLDSAILDSDEASRRAAAEAVASDAEGFERVLDAAPESLRPDLERLRGALLEPDEIEAHRADTVVVESVEAVRDATPPDLCGWAR